MVQPAIVVDGRGGLPEEVCRQLRLAGGSRVQGGPFAADAAEALLGLDPRARPAVVVLVSHSSVPVDTTLVWQRTGVPHLPVTCDGLTSVIGPLVVPGVSACWRCHALTSHDLDAVGGRIDGGAFALDPVALPPGGLGVLTAAITSTIALAVVAGATRLAGVSTELEVDGPSVTHRHWPRHPLCPDCGQSDAVTWPRAAQDTMAG